MTRKEQILNESVDYSFVEENFIEYDDCGDICDDRAFIQKAFEEGARWADNHPKEGMVSIDKVCEWLESELFEDPAEPNPYYLSDVKSKTYDYLDDFIQNFRKAIEE